MSDKNNPFETFCQRLTSFISGHAGTVTALIIFVAALIIFVWDVNSRLAIFVEDLLTLLSFVLLFFLQRSQSKDTLSLHIKLNELLVTGEKSDSNLINVEHKSEAELKDLHDNLIALHVEELVVENENSPAGLSPSI